MSQQENTDRPPISLRKAYLGLKKDNLLPSPLGNNPTIDGSANAGLEIGSSPVRLIEVSCRLVGRDSPLVHPSNMIVFGVGSDIAGLFLGLAGFWMSESENLKKSAELRREISKLEDELKATLIPEVSQLETGLKKDIKQKTPQPKFNDLFTEYEKYLDAACDADTSLKYSLKLYVDDKDKLCLQAVEKPKKKKSEPSANKAINFLYKTTSLVKEFIVFLSDVLSVLWDAAREGVRVYWPVWWLLGILISGATAAVIFNVGLALVVIIPSIYAAIFLMRRGADFITEIFRGVSILWNGFRQLFLEEINLNEPQEEKERNKIIGWRLLRSLFNFTIRYPLGLIAFFIIILPSIVEFLIPKKFLTNLPYIGKFFTPQKPEEVKSTKTYAIDGDALLTILGRMQKVKQAADHRENPRDSDQDTISDTSSADSEGLKAPLGLMKHTVLFAALKIPNNIIFFFCVPLLILEVLSFLKETAILELMVALPFGLTLTLPVLIGTIGMIIALGLAFRSIYKFYQDTKAAHEIIKEANVANEANGAGIVQLQSNDNKQASFSLSFADKLKIGVASTAGVFFIRILAFGAVAPLLFYTGTLSGIVGLVLMLGCAVGYMVMTYAQMKYDRQLADVQNQAADVVAIKSQAHLTEQNLDDHQKYLTEQNFDYPEKKPSTESEEHLTKSGLYRHESLLKKVVNNNVVEGSNGAECQVSIPQSLSAKGSQSGGSGESVDESDTTTQTTTSLRLQSALQNRDNPFSTLVSRR
jgi:hypothetical protein